MVKELVPGALGGKKWCFIPNDADACCEDAAAVEAQLTGARGELTTAQEDKIRLEGEVRRLSRLVASLLDISRIQAGDRKFTMTAFDVCEMARQILISFEQKIDAKVYLKKCARISL